MLRVLIWYIFRPVNSAASGGTGALDKFNLGSKLDSESVQSGPRVSVSWRRTVLKLFGPRREKAAGSFTWALGECTRLWSAWRKALSNECIACGTLYRIRFADNPYHLSAFAKSICDPLQGPSGGYFDAPNRHSHCIVTRKLGHGGATGRFIRDLNPDRHFFVCDDNHTQKNSHYKDIAPIYRVQEWDDTRFFFFASIRQASHQTQKPFVHFRFQVTTWQSPGWLKMCLLSFYKHFCLSDPFLT